MCYSAQLEQEIKKLERMARAQADYEAYERLFELRLEDESQAIIPKAMEANFDAPSNAVERRIKKRIDEYRKRRTKQLETDLFKQRKRLADAVRKLAMKETKKAREDERIAGNKVRWNSKKIADLTRTRLEERDSRIFPMWYAPVIVMEDGRRVIRPMRYNCRPAGKPARIDSLGTLYNARRDNLGKFWKQEFENTRGIVVMSSFYENVARHDYEHRQKAEEEATENVVLHFNPKPRMDMLVACLWSHWQTKDRDKPALYSFAAITDEPPPEIAATGHERCIIPIKHANLDTWLQPGCPDVQKLYAVMDDRERPLYEHTLAA